MVARCLGGRVGAAGGIRGGLGKERQRHAGGGFIRVGQVAIHLVGGDMVEAERRLARLVQAIPIRTSRFQQHIGADDIGLDKIGRAGDGAIDVTLCRQMHHGIGLMRGKHPIQLGAVADVDLLKRVAIAARDLSQGFQVACIGQLVEVDH